VVTEDFRWPWNSYCPSTWRLVFDGGLIYRGVVDPWCSWHPNWSHKPLSSWEHNIVDCSVAQNGWFVSDFVLSPREITKDSSSGMSRLVRMLFVEFILVAPKLWVSRLDILVSKQIIHLETRLNEDIGCRQATEPQGEILSPSCLYFAMSHLYMVSFYLFGPNY